MADWEVWQQLLAWAASALVGSGIAATIVQLYYKHLLDKRLKEYGSTLETELENHKSNLQKKLTDFQIKHSRLHDLRSSLIVELHEAHIDLRSATWHILRPDKLGPVSFDPKLQEKLCTEMLDLRNQFKLLVLKAELVLPNDVFHNLDYIANTYHDVTDSIFDVFVELHKNLPVSEDLCKKAKTRLDQLAKSTYENLFRRELLAVKTLQSLLS